MTAAQFFEKKFGRPPTSTARAPGRINLIGEHLDYNGGTVLPMAIDRHIEVAVAPSGLDWDAICSLAMPDSIEAALDAPPSGGWQDYAAGAAQRARALGLVSGGMEIAIAGDLPHGVGLSSSAALLVALLRAIFAGADEAPEPAHIAKLAQAIENEFVGVPCGIMDQMAVSLSTPGAALAIDCRDLSTTLISFPTSHEIVTIHSGVERQLRDGRFRQRLEECGQARSLLGTQFLCHPEEPSRIETLPEPLNRRARHAVTEQDRVERAIAALNAKDMISFGYILDEGHASLSKDFGVSTPMIDDLTAFARLNGALGARLTGAGFGGCIIALVRRDQSDGLVEQMKARFPMTARV